MRKQKMSESLQKEEESYWFEVKYNFFLTSLFLLFTYIIIVGYFFTLGKLQNLSGLVAEPFLFATIIFFSLGCLAALLTNFLLWLREVCG